MAGTTTNYGWTYPTSTDLVKDGATAIQTAIQGADTSLFNITGGRNVGLQFISSSTLSGSSTIISNCFSSSFSVYKIELFGVTLSAGGALQMQLRTGSTTAASDYKTERFSAASTTISSDRDAATYAWNFNKDAIDNANGTITVYNPFASLATFVHAEMSASSSTTAFLHSISGLHSLATSYQSLVFSPTGGTFTGGTVKIYGATN